MTNANRASRKAGKKSPSAQSGKTPQIDSVKAAQIKVSIVAEVSGASLELFQLPDAVTEELLQRMNSEGGRDIGMTIAQALARDFVAKKRGYFPSVEFELVMGRTIALLHLVESKLQNDLIDKSNLRSPEYNPVEASRSAGYLDMFHHAQKDLRTVFDSVFAWLQAKPTQAA